MAVYSQLGTHHPSVSAGEEKEQDLMSEWFGEISQIMYGTDMWQTGGESPGSDDECFSPCTPCSPNNHSSNQYFNLAPMADSSCSSDEEELRYFAEYGRGYPDPRPSPELPGPGQQAIPELDLILGDTQSSGDSDPERDERLQKIVEYLKTDSPDSPQSCPPPSPSTPQSCPPPSPSTPQSCPPPSPSTPQSIPTMPVFEELDVDHQWPPIKTGVKQKRVRRCFKLWQFILELLADPLYEDKVRWVDREKGVFTFIQSQEVAALWGQRKNKPGMTYEHLARAIRHYYKQHVMRRINGRRLVYQFGPNASGWQSGRA